MKISLEESFQIFSNPRDLKIAVWQKEGTRNFFFTILRGPGRAFELIYFPRRAFVCREDAIDALNDILKGVERMMWKEFSNSTSHSSRTWNPEGRSIDRTKVLDKVLIGRIIDEVNTTGEANTYDES